MGGVSPPSGGMALSAGRRWDVDWLRTLAVLLLVPYHAARIFDADDPFYVQNARPSRFLTDWVIALGDAVGMQLLFLLAGIAAWFALRTRSNRMYLRERLHRLLPPLVLGTLLLVPPQTYLGLRTHADYRGTFVEYLPRFLEFHAEDVGGYTQGGFTPAHLWFILFLLAFSVAGLPLFRWLGGRAGSRLAARNGDLSARPGVIFLWAIPMIGLERLVDATAYENPVLLFLYFFWFFIAGYVMMSDVRIAPAIDRQRHAALLVGPVLWLVLRLLPDRLEPSWLAWVRRSLFDRGTFTWLTILCLLAYGRRFLSKPTRFLAYFGEAGYPFYVLHQTVLVLIGYHVVGWQVPLAAKYVTVALLTFGATTLVYESVIRHSRTGRMLFGMKVSGMAGGLGARNPTTM